MKASVVTYERPNGAKLFEAMYVPYGPIPEPHEKIVGPFKIVLVEYHNWPTVGIEWKESAND